MFKNDNSQNPDSTNTIQIASDLHIEYTNGNVDPLSYITPSAPILLLSGDIGSAYRPKQLFNFLERLCPHFQYVFFIPGNHEYYYLSTEISEYGKFFKSITFLNNVMKDICNSIKNLYFLDKKCVVINNICIAGCTLWSKPTMQNIPRFLVKIAGISTERFLGMHNTDVEFVRQTIRKCKENKYKLLMVTHYPPTFEVLNLNYKHKKFMSLYATDLDHLLSSDQVHTWISGHTHFNHNTVSKNGTILLSNQHGSSSVHPKYGYKKDIVFEI